MSAAVVETAVGWRALARVICDGSRPWIDRAACAGTDPRVFSEKAHERQALALCAGCPVRAQCRADALTFEHADFRLRRAPTGVVGGMTAAQRQAVHRARWADRCRAAQGGPRALFDASELAGDAA